MKIESLVAALGSPQRKKRLYALIDLGMLGRKAKAAAPAIQGLLVDQDEEIRINAVLALKDILGKTAEPAIVGLLEDASPKVRACTAATVSSIGNKALAYPILRKMLDSPVQTERDAANMFKDDVPVDFFDAVPSNNSHSPMASDVLETRVVSCLLGEQIEITIRPIDQFAPAASLTAIQGQCLQMITQLTKQTATAIRSELVRKFVHEGHGHLLRNDDHQDIEMTIHSAVIPALKDAKDAYFFLCGESVADIEHGFACLFKNDTQFCACAPELSRENYRLDDVGAFEDIFRSHHVAFIRANE